jgi:glycosyltransferase involved in cell wall biosynthesis
MNDQAPTHNTNAPSDLTGGASSDRPPIAPDGTPPVPDPRLAIVIPAHNNELSIGSLVLLARQYAGYVIVVDDSSQDKTLVIAAHAGATVINAGEFGGGRVYSILAGCRYALGYGCTVVVTIDSTGKYLSRDIPQLIAPVLSGEADLVVGSRNLHGRKGIPPYQFNTDEKSCALPKKSREFSSTDPDSTFRAMSVKAITLLDLLPNSDQFEPMMITLFSRRNLVVKEIPITPRHEVSSHNEVDTDIPRYRENKVAVVVPAYNEELLIGDTLMGIPDFICRIYVVDDCSRDRTRDVIDYYARNDRSIVPIYHEVNKGPGGAISNGYTRALDDGMDIVATMDGDNQMDPAFLPQLLDPIIDKKCDFTMGNRLVNVEFRKGMSRWRFFGNTMLTLLTKIASGYWSMVDPQNGFTAISKRALERLDVNTMYPRYGYLNDRLVRLNTWGFRVINIPHPSRYGKEKSGIKYSTYIYRLSSLLLLSFLWRLKTKYVMISFNPLVFFYFAGALLTLLAFILGIYSFVNKFVFGEPIFVPAVLTLILLSLGLQSMFFAMFFDMEQEKADNGWYS